MTRVIMVQGTMSGAGKSLLTAGLCRIFRQDGLRVMPFKSQNMALNSFITAEGLEMGRAQVMQAEAAGVSPCVDMNPILLKPTGDTGSQVIVNGEVRGNMSAVEYFRRKRELLPDILAAYRRLQAQADVIVIEGAGSPAEINLKQNDIVNMGLAELVNAPVLLVGDIDRGGVFAQLYGTVALLEKAERERIRGLIINKFRGDRSILEPGIEMIEARTGKPVVGVVPWKPLRLEDEDSLTDRFHTRHAGRIDLAVLRFPRISNFTDFDVFERFPGVSVRYIADVRDLGMPDLIFLPGSKNTIEDLRWLRESGLEAMVRKAQHGGTVIFGICGGYQMLGREIRDPEGVESGGSVRGIGLLPFATVLSAQKTRSRVRGQFGEVRGALAALSGLAVEGYEIHMGVTEGPGELPYEGELSYETDFLSGREALCRKEPLLFLRDSVSGTEKTDGCAAENVYGSYVHGLFDAGELAEVLLRALADRKGIDLAAPEFSDYRAFRESQYTLLADTMREALRMEDIYRMMENCGGRGIA